MVRPVLRTPAARLIKQGEIERTVEFAALKNKGQGSILVLLDCDDGCPAVDGPELLKRASGARGDLLISVVLAKREYEAWFWPPPSPCAGNAGCQPIWL